MFRCGVEGNLAAECTGVVAAPINLFWDEDFPPLVARDLPSHDGVGGEVPLPPADLVVAVGPACVDCGVHDEVVVCAAPPPRSVSSLPPVSAPVSDSAPLLPSTSLQAPSPMLDPSPTAAPVPSSVSSVGSGLVPCVLEAAILRGRATPVGGQSTAGSSQVPPAGGDSSDDQRPCPKRSRTDAGASPPRSWAEECEDAGSVDVSSASCSSVECEDGASGAGPPPAIPVSPASSAEVPMPPKTGSSSFMYRGWARPLPPDVEIPEYMEYLRCREGRSPTELEYLIWEAYKRKYPPWQFPEKYPPR
nr:vegetative cell wall protein gp1-like [Procambarus clarkii]